MTRAPGPTAKPPVSTASGRQWVRRWDSTSSIWSSPSAEGTPSTSLSPWRWRRRSSISACSSAARFAMAERLANRLKERRSELGLTQAELAEKVGVTRKTVNTVENGVFTPSATLAIKLAAALELSVETLFWIEH